MMLTLYRHAERRAAFARGGVGRAKGWPLQRRTNFTALPPCARLGIGCEGTG